ncbi:MAG: STAS domain-containing protein [Planctomycetales bacterium]|nr:STAS domain-containing protein [Planctomycetales bacterium]
MAFIADEVRLFEIKSEMQSLIATICEERLASDVDASIMRQHLLDVFLRTNSRLLVVDFTAVRFFSSAYVGMLLHLRNLVHSSGGELVIVGMDVPLNEVMRIMNLQQVFKTYRCVDEALKARFGSIDGQSAAIAPGQLCT